MSKSCTRRCPWARRSTSADRTDSRYTGLGHPCPRPEDVVVSPFRRRVPPSIATRSPAGRGGCEGCLDFRSSCDHNSGQRERWRLSPLRSPFHRCGARRGAWASPGLQILAQPTSSGRAERPHGRPPLPGRPLDLHATRPILARPTRGRRSPRRTARPNSAREDRSRNSADPTPPRRGPRRTVKAGQPPRALRAELLGLLLRGTGGFCPRSAADGTRGRKLPPGSRLPFAP